MTREEALKLLGGVLQGYLLKDDINQIFNDHEAQLKLASDVYSTDKMHMYQELKAKDDEIRRLNNLYADTIKDLGEVLIEIERLKALQQPKSCDGCRYFIGNNEMSNQCYMCVRNVNDQYEPKEK